MLVTLTVVTASGATCQTTAIVSLVGLKVTSHFSNGYWYITMTIGKELVNVMSLF